VARDRPMGVHAGVKLSDITDRPLSKRWGCPVVLLGSRSRVRGAWGVIVTGMHGRVLGSSGRGRPASAMCEVSTDYIFHVGR
jgi:hypothetical protein